MAYLKPVELRLKYLEPFAILSHFVGRKPQGSSILSAYIAGVMLIVVGKGPYVLLGFESRFCIMFPFL
jgi:hypothetical protein